MGFAFPDLQKMPEMQNPSAIPGEKEG